MTSRRTALYLAGGALFVACLAAANMPQPPDRSSDQARPSAPAPTLTLADEVRSQASRLQTRLAQAPVPENSPRNPFAFGAVARASHSAPVDARVAATPAEPLPPAPIPALTLMGIAEESIPGGVRRTAIISLGEGTSEADGIVMVTEGAAVGDRYKVTRIGADAVELEDLLTRGYRRIAMR